MRPFLAASLVLLALLMPVFATSVTAYYEGFTHAVYVESVVGTWCPHCRNDVPLVSETYEKYKGSLHFVMFHFRDEWDTEQSGKKIQEYEITGTPTHAYDAGFAVKAGAIDQGKIESTGKRVVHRVSLAVAKKLQGYKLTFEGHIKEEDGSPFNGKIVVIAVENDRQSRGLTWNHIFRAYLLQENITLVGGEYRLFSGAWSIPSDAYVPGTQVVAVAYDFTDKSDKGTPLAIQSVSDVTSGVVIPEFDSTPAIAAMAIIISITIMRTPHRRRTYGCNQYLNTQSSSNKCATFPCVQQGKRSTIQKQD